MNLLLIASGWAVHGYELTTEILHLGDAYKVCNGLGTTPIVAWGAVGGLLHNNYPMICGGNVNHSDIMDRCHIIGDNSQIPISMSIPRTSAASVVLNGNTLWITGGFNGSDLTGTTEYVTLDGAVNGPELPVPNGVDQHCIIAIDSVTTLLIGGRRNGYKAWLFNHIGGFWTELSDTKFLRNMASCGAIVDSADESTTIIMITGGGDVRETEIMINATDAWLQVLDFPSKVNCGSSVVTADRRKAVVFGYQDEEALTTAMYSFQCFNKECQWTKMLQQLNVARQNLVGMLLPESMGTCYQSQH